jgi:hypothetical protein
MEEVRYLLGMYVESMAYVMLKLEDEKLMVQKRDGKLKPEQQGFLLD